ncbi:MAG: hypothetical protein NVSMB17_19850 [Candidatus Dormibacteria bacterium]
MADEVARGRRRWRLLVLFGLVLALGYPLLLDAATGAGLSLGLRRDVNAQRDLLRALSYAGDRDGAVGFSSDAGQPLIAPLDRAALSRQLGDSLPPSSDPTPVPGAAPATSPTVPPPAAASPAPTGPPRAGPPPATAPPATAPAAPPPGTCPGAPVGSTRLNLRAQSAGGGNIGGATVSIYYRGCLVASGTTNSAGRLNTVANLAPNTTYTYVVSASGYRDSVGSFDTQGNSKVSVDVVMTPA